MQLFEGQRSHIRLSYRGNCDYNKSDLSPHMPGVCVYVCMQCSYNRRLGYNVANAPPSTGNVEDKKSKVRCREKHDEHPGQHLQWVPGPVPAVATRVVQLLELATITPSLSLRCPASLLHPPQLRGRHAQLQTNHLRVKTNSKTRISYVTLPKAYREPPQLESRELRALADRRM